MGKKALKTRHYPFWPFFGRLGFSFLFFRKNTYRASALVFGSLGFTLIEMVVAIGVLAIFASFLFATINPFEQFKKASDTQRKSDLAQIQRALEAYNQDFGRYPQSSGNKIVYNSSALDWGSAWAPYIDVLPKDPKPTKMYVYEASADGQSYWLYASLERGGLDPQACNKNGTACPNVPGGVTCGGASDACSFGVSSPNTSP